MDSLDYIKRMKFPMMKPGEFLLGDNMGRGAEYCTDVESYKNLFFVGTKNPRTGNYNFFRECSRYRIDRDRLSRFMNYVTNVGFNFYGYDLYAIKLFLDSGSTQAVHEFTDHLINSETHLQPWEIGDYYNIEIPKQWRVIDLMPIAPLSASLKMYAARLHAPVIQELPFPPDTVLSDYEADIVCRYCFVDCNDTHLIYERLAPQIAIRKAISAQYKMDVMSASDSQITEKKIRLEMQKRGISTKPPQPPRTVQYCDNDLINFKTRKMQEIYDTIVSSVFPVSSSGKVKWPEGLGEKTGDAWEYVVELGGESYRMGIGGLHSCEAEVSYRATDEYEIADNDFASFYPKIILALRLAPKHIGEQFLEIFDEFVQTRLAAKKRSKDKSLDAALREAAGHDAGTLKIVINGLFGKLSSIYSAVSAPELLLQVTLTGQFLLLMMIERCNMQGFRVISANTDGLITYTLRSRRAELRKLMMDTAEEMEMQLEETQYSALYSANVNNYIAVMAKTQYDEKGKAYEYKPNAEAEFLQDRLGLKCKGYYSEVGSAQASPLSKSPEQQIISDAIYHYVTTGRDVAETIYNCRDIRRFLLVKKSTGGAVLADGEALGKVIRFYYSTTVKGSITRADSGHTIPKTENAQTLMILPNDCAHLPTDLDLGRYVTIAREALYTVAARKRPTQKSLLS